MAGRVRQFRVNPTPWPCRRISPRRSRWLEQELTWPRTDAFAQSELHIVPLSVSAGKIAMLPSAALFCWPGLKRRGPVDRSGLGPLVEVYPAASLKSWGPRRPSSAALSTVAAVPYTCRGFLAGLSRVSARGFPRWYSCRVLRPRASRPSGLRGTLSARIPDLRVADEPFAVPPLALTHPHPGHVLRA
jgi:hypothetical protein